jgi:hypothetical protein
MPRKIIAEDHRGRSSRKIIAKDHREKVFIIIAGYKDNIENKLYSFNPGMASRFKLIQKK